MIAAVDARKSSESYVLNRGLSSRRSAGPSGLCRLETSRLSRSEATGIGAE
jgi:hypothetical protein